MNSKKSDKEKRNKHVSVLMTTAERKFFKFAASRQGISTAALLRSAAYKLVAKENLSSDPN